MKLSLQQRPSCKAVAELLGFPFSRLARWVRQARIDRGQTGTATRACSTVSGSARRTVSSGGQRIISLKWQYASRKSGCRREVSPDRSTCPQHSFAWLCRQLAVAARKDDAHAANQANRTNVGAVKPFSEAED